MISVVSPIRILVAPDKFKDSLDARGVAVAITAGLRDILPAAEITLLPIADGGEGTAQVICDAAGGEWHSCEAHDPLGEILAARYCTIAHGSSAVMEMSEASGLWRLPPAKRDPIKASSFGTGEMLLDAARSGVNEIILGLGGSATNDGGFGMARALGFTFCDSKGANLAGPVEELLRLDHIEKPSELRLPKIIALTDVRNPLLGDRGATRVFASQKGALPTQIELLEQALTRLADVAERDLSIDCRDVPGAGAAGGLGFGLMSFCSAHIRSGFEFVAERTGLEAAIAGADIVITAEGRFDAQTFEGKAPAGVARLARRSGKPVYAIVGSVAEDVEDRALFDDIYELARPPLTTGDAITRVTELTSERARELARRRLT